MTILEAAARALFDHFASATDFAYPANAADDPYGDAAEVVLAAVTPLIRAAALEEAAKVAENHPWGCPQIGTAIRALKEQP